MAVSNKTKEKLAETQLIAGLQKSSATLITLFIMGKAVTVIQAIAVLQARIQAITAAQAARVALADAVAQQNLQLASTDPFVDSLVTVIRGSFAGSPNALADFGLAPKKAATITSAVKQAAVEKRTATREARHTKSAKQKASIHGTVPVATTPAPAAVSVTAPAATGVAGGGSTTPHS